MGSQFPLEGLILAQPEAAASIFASDAQPSIPLVRNSDPFLAPPWRIIYRMINSDPGQERCSSSAVAIGQIMSYRP